MKNELLSDIFYCFLASMTAFILVPVFMIGGSPEDYKFIEFSTLFKTGLLFSIVVGLLLGFVCTVLHGLNFRKSSKLYSFFVFLWVLVVGFFMPASISTGMVDPESIQIDWFNVLASTVIAVALSFAGLTSARRYIKVFIIVVLVTTITPALFSIYESNIWVSAIKKSQPFLKLSNKKNILVISFDGMPGYIVTDLIKENKKYSEALKDFMVFSNATSQSPATGASQLGELFGIRDYKSMGKSRADVIKSLDSKGVVDKLLVNHIPDSYRYGYIGFPAKPVKMVTSAQLAQQKIDTFDFFRYPIARLWTGRFLKFINWNNNTDSLQKYLANPGDSFDIVSRLRNHKGSKWDKEYILQKSFFDEYVEKISVGDKEFSVRYLHFVFTHFPVDFDENCNYRSDDKAWHELHQNEDGIKSQTKCAIDLFSSFLKKLKALGVYDNSLIVFKSDHGEPSNFFSTYPNNLTINGTGRWGYNRYRPTLLVKDFNVNSASPVFKDNLVLLNDLAKTLCEKSDLKIECEAFPGVNLLGDDLERDTPYYLYVVTDSEGGHFKFDYHISVKIPSRKTSLLEAMNKSDFIKLQTRNSSKPQSVGVNEEDKKEYHVHYKKRMTDINNVKKALSLYYEKHNKYPLSKKWSGIYSEWGESSSNYINGLVPEFIDSLPVDPRESNDGSKNYLYSSDGKDYKFIVHGAPSYDMANVDEKLIDPKRERWAYGIWSEGGKNW